MAMYQFLIAVRSGPAGGGAAAMLMNEAGEITSHIQGMFNRTIKMMTSGLRPVYVFDGKPPELKGGELAKRLARRAKAEADLAEAKAAEATEDVDRFSRRLVKVTRQHNEECQELLRLMGVPYFIAPCEAEAQCAELARKGKVYATATEDMDALTFQSPKLLRKLTFSQSSKEKQPILEIDFSVVLAGLGLTYEQFVDLCILCGCDYCSTIKGIGPKTALKLIKQHHSLEKIISALQSEKKYDIPADWFEQRVRKTKPGEPIADDNNEEEDLPGDVEESAEEGEKETKQQEPKEETEQVQEEEGLVTTCESETVKEDVVNDEPGNEEDFEVVPPLYVQARRLFTHCEVMPADSVELKWADPDETGLTTFLVDRMGFNPERVVNAIKRLKEALQQKSQKRMDSFFQPQPSSNPSAGAKRKAPEPAKGSKAKAKKK
eukprot:scaffold125_cov156-Ochromonas_danica.AAC.5